MDISLEFPTKCMYECFVFPVQAKYATYLKLLDLIDLKILVKTMKTLVM